jgi:hypothetical protein
MARRLTFEEFDRTLRNGSMPLGSLADYVEFDPGSAVPQLRFRADALLDSPPADYDVDQAVYDTIRAREDAREERFDLFVLSVPGLPRVVAEGDSWFRLPVPLRPMAIADRMRINERYRVKNIARWGHTLKDILKRKEYLEEIDDRRTDFFIVSAGGNDIQTRLEKGELLHEYDPERPDDEYLTAKGLKTLERIEKRYEELLNEVTGEFRDLRILCHGYDYPRPLVGEGKYVGRFLSALHIPDDRMDEIIRPVIDRLNQRIQSAVNRVARCAFVSCLTVTDPFTWYDDMHPDTEGFRALARTFENALDQL